jgi:hypothetical protein
MELAFLALARNQAAADMHESTRAWLVALQLDSDAGADRAYDAWVRDCAIYDHITDHYLEEVHK